MKISDVGYMRRYIGSSGNSLVTVYRGRQCKGRKVCEAVPSLLPACMIKSDWIAMDVRVCRVIRTLVVHDMEDTEEELPVLSIPVVDGVEEAAKRVADRMVFWRRVQIHPQLVQDLDGKFFIIAAGE